MDKWSVGMTDDDPVTLQEACDIVFRGKVGPTTLRSEAAKGRLRITRIEIGRAHV
mgnify:CR=1 FL=1